MSAALLAAAVAWLLVPGSTRRRARTVLGGRARREPVPVDLVGAALVVLAATLLVGWPWGTLAALAGSGWVRVRIRALGSTAQRRHDARVRAQLPGSLDLVAAALEAGRPAGAAFALAADASPEPVATELSAVAHRLTVGTDAADVWAAVAAGPLAPVGRALRRSERTGMPAAGLVATAASDLRRERRDAATRRSRSVGVATAAPLGLCFLPAFVCVGIVPMLLGLGRDLLP